MVLFSACSLWERQQFEFTYQVVSESEIVVDFTKINSGSWDTLLFVRPYATSQQLGIGYLDSEFLAQRAVNDGVIISSYIFDGEMDGYTSCPRFPVDFDQLFDDLDSVSVLKIPRLEAVFRFVKNEEGRYRLKK
ncbi:hypothetical protein DDT91_05540 [Algoriphagus sp. AK58]|nr:hypothetical protein [Algoriphagus sp. AK58]